MSKARELLDIYEREMWLKSVKTKWKAPEGLYKQDAKSIAADLKKLSKGGLKQAMARLNFYINRAGGDPTTGKSNLSKENYVKLQKAKEELRKLYQ